MSRTPTVHVFVKKQFNKFTYCSFCSKFIWGLHKQGFGCQRCGYPVHQKCLSKAKALECPGMKTRTSTDASPSGKPTGGEAGALDEYIGTLLSSTERSTSASTPSLAKVENKDAPFAHTQSTSHLPSRGGGELATPPRSRRSTTRAGESHQQQMDDLKNQYAAGGDIQIQLEQAEIENKRLQREQRDWQLEHQRLTYIINKLRHNQYLDE